MLFRDSIGRQVDNGAPVALNIGSDLAVGKLVGLQSGLVTPENQQGQAVATIAVLVQRPVLPDGRIMGVLALPNQTEVLSTTDKEIQSGKIELT